jgi:hypothetical protein
MNVKIENTFEVTSESIRKNQRKHCNFILNNNANWNDWNDYSLEFVQS